VRVELFCAFCVILFLIVRPRMRAVLRVVRAARPYPQCHQAVRRGRLGERAAGDARGTRSEAAARRRPAGLPRSGSGGRPGWRRCLLPRHGRCGRRSTGTAGCCLAILVVTFCEIQCRARPSKAWLRLCKKLVHGVPLAPRQRLGASAGATEYRNSSTWTVDTVTPLRMVRMIC
jgi:hypothetical protein